jgi:gluconate 2-dehydrogenase gamma chain
MYFQNSDYHFFIFRDKNLPIYALRIGKLLSLKSHVIIQLLLDMLTQNRRDFIKTASLAFGSVLLMPSCNFIKSSYRFFTTQEALCIIAVCEQLIPADESPGATDAGVIYYIDRQLAGVFHYDQETYRTGIKNLQSYCIKNHGKYFELLAHEVQTNILKMMESNQLNDSEWSENGAVNFFNLVLSHTMQGFYGSPVHGGNKDYISFKMLKIDYPLVIGQNRYRG